MIRIAISGAGGRMGRALYDFAKACPDIEVVFGVDTYCVDLSYPVFDTFDCCTLTADVVVDFSNPSALDGILDYAEKTGAKVILATTGYSDAQQEKIKYYSKKMGIFQASNMSLGVGLLCQLSKDATRFLDGYDIEIVETHHNKKADAPSGTALTLAKEINQVKDNSLDLLCGRDKSKRSVNDLTIHSVRGGTTVGKHSVMFFGCGENLTISHEAESKDLFASGAVSAVKFIMTKKKGLYGIKDLLTHCKPITSISIEKGFSVLSLTHLKEKDIAQLFKDMKDNNLPVDEVCQTSNNSSTFSLHLSFKGDDCLQNHLENINHTAFFDQGKIVISGVESNKIAFDILSVLKGVSANVTMMTTSQNTISIFIAQDKLIECEYALKSYFKI